MKKKTVVKLAPLCVLFILLTASVATSLTLNTISFKNSLDKKKYVSSILESISQQKEVKNQKDTSCNPVSQDTRNRSPEVEWIETYYKMGYRNSEGKSVVQLPSGDYVVVGDTRFESEGYMLFLKAGPDGELKEMKHFGDEEVDGNYGYCVQKTQDNCLIMAGGRVDQSINDAWIKKTTLEGEPLWDKIYDISYDDNSYYINLTSDGGFIFSGSTRYGSTTSYTDGWLVKIDESGTEQWNQTYGGEKNDRINRCFQTSDGGFVLFGSRVNYSNNRSLYEPWIVKTDEIGDVIWERTYDGSRYARYIVDSAGVPCRDGGYVFNTERRIVKVNETGKILWKYHLNSSYPHQNIRIQSIRETTDNGIIAVGRSIHKASGYYIDYVYLIKLNSSGERQWELDTFKSYAFDVRQTSDEGYILTGGDAFLMKVAMIPNNISTMSDPHPEDGAVDVDTSPTLSVEVNDTDGQSMDVTFYNAKTHLVIGTDSDVPSGERASIVWSNLWYDKVYKWYCVVDDGVEGVPSPIWSFTTRPNVPPHAPSNPDPVDGSTAVDLSPRLSVEVNDPDGDKMKVIFYDASDDSVIGEDKWLCTGDYASVIWSDVTSYDTSYSWYAIANDTRNETSSDTWSFTTRSNVPPDAPSDPDPVDGAEASDVKPRLSVDVNDTDGHSMDVTFYDASDNSMIDMDSDVASGDRASVVWADRAFNTTYSWYVIVNDSFDETESATWSFTTKSNKAPYAPFNPHPVNTSVDMWINTRLTWSGGDPHKDDTVCYDVYFGTSETPPLVKKNCTRTAFDPGQLDYETCYFWRIVSKDSEGITAEGSLWQFTTEKENDPENTRPPLLDWEQSFEIGTGEDVKHTSDGGFIVTGYFKSNVIKKDLVLIKTDSAGIEEWNYSVFGTNKREHGYSVLEDSDGNFVAVGTDTDSDTCLIVKVDKNGKEVWNKTYDGGNEEAVGHCILEVSDGGYLIAGEFKYRTSHYSRIWLLRIDQNGEELWNVSFGQQFYHYIGYSVQEISTGGFIIAGEHEYMRGKYKFILLKTDNAGNKLWEKTYGGQGQTYREPSVVERFDGGFVIGGFQIKYRDNEAFVVKTNETGDEEWSRVYETETDDTIKQIASTTDGGFVITGTRKDYSSYPYDNALLFKINASGNITWEITIDGYRSYSCQEIPTDDFILTGQVDEDNSLWLAQVSAVNFPPNTPSSPDPSDGSTGVSRKALLSWTGGDPNKHDPVLYDVYLGTESSPPLAAQNVEETLYDPGWLEYNTTYYWKINATDSEGVSSEGPIWSFTTEIDNDPPYTPSAPHPEDNAEEVNITLTLSWTGGDPDPDDVVTYDVYLGTTEDLSLNASNIETPSLNLEALAFNTTYFWKVVAKDQYGFTSPGPVWQFTTKRDNQPPNVPGNPQPEDDAEDVELTVTLSWTGGDPDEGDSVMYDVWFGPCDDMQLVASELGESEFDLPEDLAFNTTYCWKIVAEDSRGLVSEGPVWSFTTKDAVSNLNIRALSDGLGLLIMIENSGDGDATAIKGTLELSGKGIVLLPGKKSDLRMPDTIMAGQEIRVGVRVLCLGLNFDLTVEITADDSTDTKKVSCVILGPFIFIKDGNEIK